MSPTTPDHDTALRRRRAVRTAALVGAVAVAIYIAFLLSGVVGR